MMNRFIKVLVVLSLIVNTVFAADKIGIYDLRYTLQADLNTSKGVNLAWDDVHAVSTLQGVVNRDTPRLYVYFVMEGENDIDAYWWNKESGYMGVIHKNIRQWKICLQRMLLI